MVQQAERARASKGITSLLIPSQAIDSQYGLITHHEWLIKEKARIERGTRRACRIETDRRGRECLAYR